MVNMKKYNPFDHTTWSLSEVDTITVIQEEFFRNFGVKPSKSVIHITDIIDSVHRSDDGSTTSFCKILFVIRPDRSGFFISYTLDTLCGWIIKR